MASPHPERHVLPTSRPGPSRHSANVPGVGPSGQIVPMARLGVSEHIGHWPSQNPQRHDLPPPVPARPGHRHPVWGPDPSGNMLTVPEPGQSEHSVPVQRPMPRLVEELVMHSSEGDEVRLHPGPPDTRPYPEILWHPLPDRKEAWAKCNLPRMWHNFPPARKYEIAKVLINLIEHHLNDLNDFFRRPSVPDEPEPDRHRDFDTIFGSVHFQHQRNIVMARRLAVDLYNIGERGHSTESHKWSRIREHFHSVAWFMMIRHNRLREDKRLTREYCDVEAERLFKHWDQLRIMTRQEWRQGGQARQARQAALTT